MNDFSDLARLTDAAFHADMSNFRRITKEEATLRATLADLDRQVRESMTASAEGLTDWRATGADHAWRKWLSGKRAETNMKLARVLVRKSEATTRLKLSFARNQVSTELVEKLAEEARQADRRRA